MKNWWTPLLALPLLAAAPTQKQLTLAVPLNDGALLNPGGPAPLPTTSPPAFTPAPTPNRDIGLAIPRASNAPSVSPSLFTRSDQYRGEGFSPNSTAQIDQERRVKPGAGLSLHVPLTDY